MGRKKSAVRESTAERPVKFVMNAVLAIGVVGLILAISELGMRYEGWPATIISGWRAAATVAPVNLSGSRGRPWRHQPSDFVVILTGAENVECAACPEDETLDLILERALRQYNPIARVITLGSAGYGEDQEYLLLQQYFTHDRADLVLVWPMIAEDVPRNTFRTGQSRPGQSMPKPTFELRGDNLLGPTEKIGEPIYKSKLSILLHRPLIDLDRNWTTLLPRADPGAVTPPSGVEAQLRVDDMLEDQRTAWSIWMTPRPARVRYGIALTHVLLRRMREAATLTGARFALLLTHSAPASMPGHPPAEDHPDGPVTLEHAGHWFLADSASRDAAIAEVTAGFNPIVLPLNASPVPSLEAERGLMTRLAETLNERDLLHPVASPGTRH
jgi:hypothetical protein